MQILYISAHIYMNSQSIVLSWNCTDKHDTIVVCGSLLELR